MNEIAIAGLFIALFYAMSAEGQQAARDLLLRFLDDPEASAEEARVYRDMLEATTQPNFDFGGGLLSESLH